MKNQYVADINDFKKYSLIRCLSNAVSGVGVCWMLTVNDGSVDGKHIGYIEKPDKWRSLDPELFESLKKCIVSENRHIRYLEKSGVLENSKFYSCELTDNINERLSYFEAARECLNDTSLVFFDPDNGIEVKSKPQGYKGSSKYIYWSELEGFYSTGKSVLIYQHFSRQKRSTFIKSISGELVKRLGVKTVYAFQGSHSVFFLIPQEEHDFSVEVDMYAKVWDGIVSVSKHSEGEELVCSSSICEVHHCQLIAGHAETQYGLFSPPDRCFKQKKEEFPHANSYVLGGCCIGGAERVSVMFCPACRYHEQVYEHTY